MNLDRLYKILAETTCQLRKGEVFEGTPELVEQAKRGDELKAGGVLEVYAMPHVNEARPEIEQVDVEFMVIGVDRKKAEEHRAELVSILDDWPKDAASPLSDGPSYISLGADIGDQGAAFQLMALGKVLKLWNVITPRSFGFEGDEARKLAGGGMILMSGYQRAA